MEFQKMFKHFIICSLLAAASLSAAEKIYPVFFKQDPGIVIDGKLYSGANDNAGEIGHIRLAPTGPIGYNKEGSAEGFCSGLGATSEVSESGSFSTAGDSVFTTSSRGSSC